VVPGGWLLLRYLGGVSHSHHAAFPFGDDHLLHHPRGSNFRAVLRHRANLLRQVGPDATDAAHCAANCCLPAFPMDILLPNRSVGLADDHSARANKFGDAAAVDLPRLGCGENRVEVQHPPILRGRWLTIATDKHRYTLITN